MKRPFHLEITINQENNIEECVSYSYIKADMYITKMTRQEKDYGAGRKKLQGYEIRFGAPAMSIDFANCDWNSCGTHVEKVARLWLLHTSTGRQAQRHLPRRLIDHLAWQTERYWSTGRPLQIHASSLCCTSVSSMSQGGKGASRCRD